MLSDARLYAVLLLGSLGFSALVSFAGRAVWGSSPEGSRWEPRAELLLDISAWDLASSRERRLAAEETDAQLEDFALRDLEWFWAGDAVHEIAIFFHAPTGMEFALLPGGTFLMGSPPGEPDRQAYEDLREVAVRPLLMARTETTQAAWARVMGETAPGRYRGDSRPVESVAWWLAAAFCEEAGLGLPTEEEWEYAARAGTTTAFFTGESVASMQGYANVADAWLNANKESVPYPISNFSFEVRINDGHGTTAPVGTYKPNAFGLFDMIGNVMEWTDGVSEDALQASTKKGQVSRPIRGGNWAVTAPMMRSAYRLGAALSGGADGIGFRAVKRL